jgi:hypothetical protein
MVCIEVVDLYIPYHEYIALAMAHAYGLEVVVGVEKVWSVKAQ